MLVVSSVRVIVFRSTSGMESWFEEGLKQTWRSVGDKCRWQDRNGRFNFCVEADFWIAGLQV